MYSFPAHIRTDADGGDKIIQTVQEHCRNTAEYAEEDLSCIGMGKAAYLAGLVHDFGKFTETFADYIRKSESGEAVRPGSVNHTFAGVRYILTHFHSNPLPFDRAVSELVAYAAGAHHGLFDLVDNRRVCGFENRVAAGDKIHYHEAEKNFLEQCADKEELERLFRAAAEEMNPVFEKIRCLAADRKTDRLFYIGMLARMLLSAVIDGDRRDTAEFKAGISFPRKHENTVGLWNDCLSYAENELKKLASDTAIQKARREISDICRQGAEKLGDIYRLNVPTGGGKTLSTLRYALAHAAKYGKQRIFFVMPLLSIIDQNSREIKKYLPRRDIVLEHHSNAVACKNREETLDDGELLVENWSSPVVITTLVQFLNTLFSGKTTSVRRFQALCNSVVIFDEVQTVPDEMLSLFNLAVNFLSGVCGMTAVLSSATQPCLEKADHPVIIQPKDNLVPYDPALWAPFRRTELKYAGKFALDQIPLFVADKLRGCRSLLVVCNKKAEAEMIYRELRGSIKHCFHLSASMCMAHRLKTIDELKRLLADGGERDILCVSTQVIEAGVDISFECVVRLTAGMDSAVQAAGRCNRNGESKEALPVYLVRCMDEDLSRLAGIRRAQAAAEELLEEFKEKPERFGNNLASDESIEYFYSVLYRDMKESGQDFYLNKIKDTMLSLLSGNEKNRTDESCKYFMQQAFGTAGKNFCVFDKAAADIIVPYEKGADLIADLCSERAKYDLMYAKETLEKARPYTVSAFGYQLEKLEKESGVYELPAYGMLALQSAFYNPDTGLVLTPYTNENQEVNTCDILML